MLDNPEAIPPLRALDCTVARREGQPVVRLQDPLGISPAAEVSLALLSIVRLFDGKRTVLDVQAEIARQTGQILPAGQLQQVIQDLDSAYFLDSDRFRARLREVMGEWENSPVRPPQHAGGPSYPEEREALGRTLDALTLRPGAVDPSGLRSDRPLRAVFAPHIDFERGGHVYTWAYHEVRRRVSAPEDGPGPVFVILGTCHQHMDQPFAVTRKGYGTPLGTAETDGRFIERLERLSGADLLKDELCHKAEHSIEFQTVFLRHALGARRFTLVPILAGGFHEAVLQGVAPENDPGVERFLDSLAETVVRTRKEEGRETVLVGSVDLAHVGQHFGDKDRLTDRFLDEVRERDQALLAAAETVDSKAFFEEVCRDGNRRRVCGVGPMYTILCVLERLGASSGTMAAGHVLAYDQAVDKGADLCVSFASMAFEDR